MISITEQELKDNITKLLSFLLNKKDILENQILKELPDDIKNPFIHTYATYDNNKGVNIPVLDTFPTNKTDNTFILIQFEASSGDENGQVISTLQGDISDISEGNLVQETLPVQFDNLGNAYVKPNKKVNDVQSCLQTSIKDFDKKNNIIYLDIVNSIDLNSVTIFYSEDLGLGDEKYLPFGLDLNEKISVDFISTNMPVLKCLYAIMLYMQAYLRLSLTNNGNVYLPNVEFAGNDYIQELNGGNSTLGQQLFYRRMEVTYKTTQTINIPTSILSDIQVQGGDSNVR